MSDEVQVHAPHSSTSDSSSWSAEKPYIMESLKELKEQVKRLGEKLDSFVAAMAEAKVQGKTITGLEEKMILSREEIAALKVKASLFGVASAAILETLFALAKNLSGK